MHGRFRRGPAPRLSFLIAAFISLSGCLSGSGGEDEPGAIVSFAETEFDHELTGSVGDGPVVGADMRVLAMDGTVVETLQSDTSAGYNVTVRTKGKYYPLIIEAKNGTDLVSNLTPDFDLLGVVLEPKRSSITNLSPFSAMAVELARVMSGGVTPDNLAAAETIVTREVNSGLDTLRDTSVIFSEINSLNVAEIVRSSEALGETIRRVRDLQEATGRVSSGNRVVRSIASDLVDEVIDGVGATNVNQRVAALTIVVSAQTLLETMQNELYVYDQLAIPAMESAILTVQPDGSAKSFDDLLLTPEMLEAVRIGLDAILAVAPSAELRDLHDAADRLQAGMAPVMIGGLIPRNYREILSAAIWAIANGEPADIDTINTISRNGGSDATSVNNSPTISGTPPTSIEEGAAYAFTPTASDPDDDVLTFTISGQPGPRGRASHFPQRLLAGRSVMG